MTDPKKSERIYLTAKTRMIAENRARKANGFLNGLTAWYSFCLIAVSVANLSGILRQGIIEFSATLMSIALFGISLFMLGGQIIQRADEHRKCYLALKGIYHSVQSEDEKMSAYEKVLEEYPNHDPIDYDIMVFESSARGQKLWNDQGEIEVTDVITKQVNRHYNMLAAAKVFAVAFPALLFVSALALSSVSKAEIRRPAQLDQKID